MPFFTDRGLFFLKRFDCGVGKEAMWMGEARNGCVGCCAGIALSAMGIVL
jgi:hypothetical protein